MTSALDGLEMLRLLGDDLGLEMPDRLGAARLRLAAGLRDATADGRGWLLVVDEVQRATAEAWEEIQALSNQLGRTGGFAAMILLGRTELARELSTPTAGRLVHRLGLHIHLPPLDLDEARELLRRMAAITESGAGDAPPRRDGQSPGDAPDRRGVAAGPRGHPRRVRRDRPAAGRRPTRAGRCTRPARAGRDAGERTPTGRSASRLAGGRAALASASRTDPLPAPDPVRGRAGRGRLGGRSRGRVTRGPRAPRASRKRRDEADPERRARRGSIRGAPGLGGVVPQPRAVRPPSRPSRRPSRRARPTTRAIRATHPTGASPAPPRSRSAPSPRRTSPPTASSSAGSAMRSEAADAAARMIATTVGGGPRRGNSPENE